MSEYHKFLAWCKRQQQWSVDIASKCKKPDETNKKRNFTLRAQLFSELEEVAGDLLIEISLSENCTYFKVIENKLKAIRSLSLHSETVQDSDWIDILLRSPDQAGKFKLAVMKEQKDQYQAELNFKIARWEECLGNLKKSKFLYDNKDVQALQNYLATLKNDDINKKIGRLKKFEAKFNSRVLAIQQWVKDRQNEEPLPVYIANINRGLDALENELPEGVALDANQQIIATNIQAIRESIHDVMLQNISEQQKIQVLSNHQFQNENIKRIIKIGQYRYKTGSVKLLQLRDKQVDQLYQQMTDKSQLDPVNEYLRKLDARLNKFETSLADESIESEENEVLIKNNIAEIRNSVSEIVSQPISEQKKISLINDPTFKNKNIEKINEIDKQRYKNGRFTLFAKPRNKLLDKVYNQVKDIPQVTFVRATAPCEF
ncbi:MAG: hypothetical protein HKM04_08265 [Legionellales bacterium]|nr:hypothetical protein [Legionellales bacterium]